CLQLRQPDDHGALICFAVLLNRGIGQVGAEAVHWNGVAELQRDSGAAGKVDAPVDAVLEVHGQSAQHEEDGKADGHEAPSNEVKFGIDEYLHGYLSSPWPRC